MLSRRYPGHPLASHLKIHLTEGGTPGKGLPAEPGNAGGAVKQLTQPMCRMGCSCLEQLSACNLELMRSCWCCDHYAYKLLGCPQHTRPPFKLLQLCLCCLHACYTCSCLTQEEITTIGRPATSPRLPCCCCITNPSLQLLVNQQQTAWRSITPTHPWAT